ncbi:MAG: hypothetical protein IJ783_01220 [Kiritimatiellae bacterium]|nr:hypothetical protein [Kiritimatiellia bacterium]
MTEEQVAKAVIEWLGADGWEILDYDFPGGGTGRRFRFSDAPSAADKNAGAFCPDVVAWKNGVFLLCENKAVDTLSDYAKQARAKAEPTLAAQLAAAYPGNAVNAILTGIAFSGPFIHRAQAESADVDFVFSVLNGNSVSVCLQPTHG